MPVGKNVRRRPVCVCSLITSVEDVEMFADGISRQGISSPKMAVFPAGNDGQPEPVTLFSDATAAEQSAHDAGWCGQYAVTTIKPLRLLQNVLCACEHGIEHRAIDPVHHQR